MMTLLIISYQRGIFVILHPHKQERETFLTEFYT